MSRVEGPRGHQPGIQHLSQRAASARDSEEGALGDSDGLVNPFWEKQYICQTVYNGTERRLKYLAIAHLIWHAHRMVGSDQQSLTVHHWDMMRR
jgi:hypothetical protein